MHRLDVFHSIKLLMDCLCDKSGESMTVNDIPAELLLTNGSRTVAGGDHASKQGYSSWPYTTYIAHVWASGECNWCLSPRVLDTFGSWHFIAWLGISFAKLILAKLVLWWVSRMWRRRQSLMENWVAAAVHILPLWHIWRMYDGARCRCRSIACQWQLNCCCLQPRKQMSINDSSVTAYDSHVWCCSV